MFIFIFISELFALYLLSRSLTKEISHLLHKFTRNKKITVYLLAFLFLPGTIIHELSHHLMAELLFVRTGKIHLIPEIIGSEIRMGQAEIEKTDFVRRFFIGVAPFIVGNIILFGAVYSSIYYFYADNKFFVLFLLYILFQTGNTMFASKKDMEGALVLIVVLACIMIAFYLIGFRLNVYEYLTTPLMFTIFRKVSLYLTVPLIFDGLLLLLLKIINR